jgi:hypothetical protein
MGSPIKAAQGANHRQQQRPSQPDEIDAILGGSKTSQHSRKVKHLTSSAADEPSSSVPVVVDFSQQRSKALSASMPSKQELARQRKLFMSAKVRGLAALGCVICVNAWCTHELQK